MTSTSKRFGRRFRRFRDRSRTQRLAPGKNADLASSFLDISREELYTSWHSRLPPRRLERETSEAIARALDSAKRQSHLGDAGSKSSVLIGISELSL